MPQLRVDGLERTLEVPRGTNLHRALKKEHVNLHWTVWGKLFNCRGIGLCESCRVRVVEGAEALPPRSKRETKRLKGKPADWRLACQIEVRHDMRIEPFPLRSLEERFGADAVALARRSPEEREEWVREDRTARREARRQAATAKVGEAPKRRGLIARLTAGKKQGKEKAEPAEAEKKKRRFGGGSDKPPNAKKETKPRPAKEGGALRGLKLRKKGKEGEKKSAGKDEP